MKCPGIVFYHSFQLSQSKLLHTKKGIMQWTKCILHFVVFVHRITSHHFFLKPKKAHKARREPPLQCLVPGFCSPLPLIAAEPLRCTGGRTNQAPGRGSRAELEESRPHQSGSRQGRQAFWEKSGQCRVTNLRTHILEMHFLAPLCLTALSS